MEGSRIFFQSLNAAVLLFSRVTNIPTESLVLPVIYTNDKLTLGCELWDVHGQNQISHLLDLFNLLISIGFKNKENTLHVKRGKKLVTRASQYVIALLVPKDGQIPVDVQSLSKQGIFQVVLYT
ncbi:hypothetical protein C5167_029541 [Papaver somniferum]|nr:hypothetical protein C5167_029541 [Papaver somniferum]